MTGRDLVREARRRLRDMAQPRLWEDAELLAYLNRMEVLFAERTHCLLSWDDHHVALVAGTARYHLDPALLSVQVAQLADSEYPLRRINSTFQGSFRSAEGRPCSYTLVPSTPLTLQVYPVPDTAVDLKIAGAVRPTEPFTMESDPRIDARWHHHLIDGAIAEAFLHADTDGFAPELSAKAEERWYTAIRDAKREVYRSAYVPNTIATAR